MKVKELIEQLKTQDQEDTVVLAIDEEGNGFRELYAVDGDNNSYIDGEVHLKEITQEFIDAGYTEDDVYDGDDAVSAVVLWP